MSVLVPVVDSWDGAARRIYLKEGVTAFHWITDIYHEYRYWRRTVETSHLWAPLMIAAGNNPKGGGKYTPRYITLLSGTRVVPFDENILIEITGEAITDNADVDPDPFDTSTRTNAIKLYITPPASELVKAVDELAAIGRMAFDGVVNYDADNGIAGTQSPIGVKWLPSNNLSDAKTIAIANGLNVLKLLSPLTIVSGEDVSEYRIVSDTWKDVTVETGAITTDTVFEKISLYGELCGTWNILVDCWVYDITNFLGWMRGGSIERVELAPYIDPDPISLGSSYFDDVVPMYANIPSVLVANIGVSISFTNCTDMVEIHSMVDGTDINAALSGGKIIIDGSCTGGQILVSGIGTLINNSLLAVDADGLLNESLVADNVWRGINLEKP
jgi:hypothetical protein